MSQHSGNQGEKRRFNGLPLEEVERLDNLCDCFEMQLLANQKPVLETFLQGCRGAVRSPLLGELLTLELEYRLQIDDGPDLQTYLLRFPEDAATVHSVFRELRPDAAPVESVSADAPAISIQNYTLLSELGTGGMGTVYRAIHTMLKNEAAIKVLKTGRQDDDALRDMFQRETSNLGQLRHPQIVQALYAGASDEGLPYLVMEMVRGLDVSRVVRRYGPLAVADACEIVRQAALGLQHASECGMVHRDIKPSNLLLGWTYGENAEVKVADFGLARIRFRHARPQGDSSDDGRVMGTLDYMSPEQFFTPADVDIRADIFSLGCTLYAILVGQPPFAGKYQNAAEKMAVHRDKRVDSFRHLRPDVPEALEEVISYAMAKSPANRFESPLEFARSLAHFNGGHDLPLLLETAEDRPAETLVRPLLVDSTIMVQPDALEQS
ncbi:MAG: serine/threonine-protein kinase [Pirellulaceae bacterium]